MAGLLLIIIVNPILTFAHKTMHTPFSIYHNKPINPLLLSEIDQAAKLLEASEFYRPALKLDICLHDGSPYPEIIQTLLGQAFAWGFYDKVVLQGNLSCEGNCVELNGYKWNLTQLLAHEMTHCLQFDKLGLFKSNPIADIPNWKWEGYAEYISRQNTDQKDLIRNIDRLQHTDKNAWEITFEDSTIAPRAYYSDWTLVQYCLDIQKMSYQQVLADTTPEESIQQEMMQWYEAHKSEYTTSLGRILPQRQHGYSDNNNN